MVENSWYICIPRKFNSWSSERHCFYHFLSQTKTVISTFIYFTIDWLANQNTGSVSVTRERRLNWSTKCNECLFTTPEQNVQTIQIYQICLQNINSQSQLQHFYWLHAILKENQIIFAWNLFDRVAEPVSLAVNKFCGTCEHPHTSTVNITRFKTQPP